MIFNKNSTAVFISYPRKLKKSHHKKKCHVPMTFSACEGGSFILIERYFFGWPDNYFPIVVLYHSKIK